MRVVIVLILTSLRPPGVEEPGRVLDVSEAEEASVKIWALIGDAFVGDRLLGDPKGEPCSLASSVSCCSVRGKLCG